MKTISPVTFAKSRIDSASNRFHSSGARSVVSAWSMNGNIREPKSNSNLAAGCRLMSGWGNSVSAQYMFGESGLLIISMSAPFVIPSIAIPISPQTKNGTVATS
jgi:hypothetical protein